MNNQDKEINASPDGQDAQTEGDFKECSDDFT